HQTDASVRVEIEAPVFGDLETPQKDDAGHVIADWTVRDMVVVTLPKEHPKIPGAPLPPGLYNVSIAVDNITSANYAGGVPARLTTNELILQLEPDPDIKFHIWSEHGHCYRETDGLGSDEIWFDAWVGNFSMDNPTIGQHTLDPVKHVEFNRNAWD